MIHNFDGNMPLPEVIAIDGPAASGKSTLGYLLAKELGYLYLDTGVMYRAVTLAALQAGLSIKDETAITHLAQNVVIGVQLASAADGRAYDVLLNGSDITWQIRQPAVETAVSPVSAYAGVRQAMTLQQREIASHGKVIMVGRDIGTVVCPEADLKIYLDASVEERARRRYKEVIARGGKAKYRVILESMRQRDAIDSTRVVAPLRPAADAVVICSDGLSIDQVFDQVKQLLVRNA
jgi:cytidylate kinase